eukprot:200797-Rhodomonas_salina.2
MGITQVVQQGDQWFDEVQDRIIDRWDLSFRVPRIPFLSLGHTRHVTWLRDKNGSDRGERAGKEKSRRCADPGRVGRCERRYVLSLSCSDLTGSHWFSAFDDQGKALLGKSADELQVTSAPSFPVCVHPLGLVALAL